MANFSTYSAWAASTSWCPLKMISTAPCQREVKVSPEWDPNPGRASNSLSLCVIANFTVHWSRETGHARAGCWAVAPAPSLSLCVPRRSVKPGGFTRSPLRAVSSPSLALGTQHPPQKACVGGLALKWEHLSVISGGLGVTQHNLDSSFNARKHHPRQNQFSFYWAEKGGFGHAKGSFPLP